RPRGRACAAGFAPGIGRTRSSVAETPPTEGLPVAPTNFSVGLAAGARKAPSTSLRRALGGLNSGRVLFTKCRLVGLGDQVVAAQVVGELDQLQASRSGAQGPGRHEAEGLNRRERREPVHPLQSR